MTATPHMPAPLALAPAAANPDLLDRLLAVVADLEANAGLGSTWHTNMAAAARIREALGPEHLRPAATRRDQMRAAMLAALGAPTPTAPATDRTLRSVA
jgi:hypothetical protein